MKSLFVVLNVFLLHTNSQPQALPENLGPVDFHAKIGNVPPKYQPMSADDVKATQKALNMVEWLRERFSTGIDHIVPPLDPFQKQRLDPTEFGQNSLISGTVQLQNLNIAGAKEFIINNVEIRTKNNRVDFSVSIPKIMAEIDLDAEVYLGFLPLYLTGHMRIDISGLDLHGALGAKTIRLNGRNVFQVDSIHLRANTKNIEVLSRLRYGDEEVSEDDLPLASWFDALKDEISQSVARTVLKEVNEVLLRAFTVEEAISFMEL